VQKRCFYGIGFFLRFQAVGPVFSLRRSTAARARNPSLTGALAMAARLSYP
jgi:hypothetical protein